MGIYEDFEITKDDMRKFLLILVLVFLVIALLITLFSQNEKAIEAKLYDAPIILGKKNYALLQVKVTNVTNKDAENVKIIVEARDRNAILIGNNFKDSVIIPKIESGQYRVTSFIIVARNNIIEGSYVVDITALLNGKAYSESVSIPVKEGKGVPL